MSDRMQPVRYAPSVAKALEVVLWLAEHERHIDVYHVVKAAFYADKVHIEKWGRPIVGDDYEAAWYGPLGQVIYGLLKRDPITLLALGANGDLPFAMAGRWEIEGYRGANLDILSQSDVDALREGLRSVSGRSFGDLVKDSHADPAYYRAQGGRMDYRDFISDDDPEKAGKVEFIAESAPYAVF